jgi:hypothetical protein
LWRKKRRVRRSSRRCRLSCFIEKEINIYAGLPEMQRKWYRSVLEKDVDAVNGRSLFTISAMPTHFWQFSLARTREKHVS